MAKWVFEPGHTAAEFCARHMMVTYVRYLGQWQTPWWEDGVDKGPKTRADLMATTTIDRLDFDVIWNAPLEKEGLVVGNEIEITINAEAILEE